MNCYPCPPLSEKTTGLRLLKLHPSPNFQDEIQAEIVESSSVSSSSTEYEALSYVWGDETVTSEINVNNRSFTVTTNLAHALQALRKDDCSRTLWIDALCINQDDLEEKSRQVQRMWQIYEAAERVIVWLGPHGGGSEAVMAYMKMKNVNNNTNMSTKTKDDLDDVQYETDTYRAGFIDIFTRQWFSRIWTLQEVAAARNLEIRCGDISVDGKIFCRMIVKAANQDAVLKKHLRKIRPAIELMGGSRLAFRAYKSPLLALLERFRSWNAKKPIDKVYSLLEFSSDARYTPLLRPDYNISPRALATRLIKFSLPSATVIGNNRSGVQSTVAFHIEGYVLGSITKRISHLDGKTFWYQSTQEPMLPGIALYDRSSSSPSPSESQISTTLQPITRVWKIDILNERELSQGSVVCLLRDALRPTILKTDQNGSFEVEMLATTVPYQGEYQNTEDSHLCASHNPSFQCWDDVLEYYQGRVDDLTRFELEWNPF